MNRDTGSPSPLIPTRQDDHAVAALWWLLIGLGLALNAAAFAIQVPAITSDLLNSDSLYPAAFYRDLFVDRSDISQWNLTPAPYFFPDMALLFPLMAAAGPDIARVYLLYTLCWSGLIVLAASYAGWQVWGRWPQALAGGLATSGLFLGMLAQPEYDRAAHQMLSVAHHGGAFMLGLWIVGLVLGGLRIGFSTPRLAALALLVACTVISDFILVTWFVLPLLITLVGFSLPGWVSWRSAGRLGAALLLGLAGAWALIALALEYQVFSWKFQWLADDSSLWENLADRRQWTAWWNMMVSLPQPALFWLANLLLWLYLLAQELLAAPQASPRRRLWLWFATVTLGASCLALLAPMSRGWAWQYTLRYLYPFYFLPPLAVISGLPVVLGPMLWTAIQVAPAATAVDLQVPRQPYPSRFACADRFLTAQNSQYGYAFNHWESELYSFLSQAGIRANLMGPNLMPAHFANNRAWYHIARGGSYGDYPRHSFALVEREGDLVRQHFGEPRLVENCGDLEVWLYDRPEDFVFRHRLRIPASLGRMAGVEKGPLYFIYTELEPLPLGPHASGIQCATGHNTFTGDEAQTTGPGRLAFGPGEPLHASLSAPPGKELLELALHGGQSYRASFRLGSEDLGSIAFAGSPEPGLQIHYLRIPVEATNRGFDRIIIEPAHAAVAGHLCVYADSEHAGS